MAGNYAAYQKGYEDKPIDVAGSHAKTADDVFNFAHKEQEKADLEAKNRKEKNEKLYGSAIAQIIDTSDGPPDGNQVATQMGDRLSYLINDSNLEGIELQNAINSTLKTGNAAIQDINTRFAEFESTRNQPKNRYLNLNGEQDEVEEFNNGNRTMMFDDKDNRAYWVGVDQNGNEVRTEVGKTTQKAEDTPDYSIPTDAIVENITSNYGANPTTPRFQENVSQIEGDLQYNVSNSIQTYHQLGNAAAAMKNADGTDLYSDDDLRRLNDIGARLEQDSGSVSQEDKDYFNNAKKTVTDFKVNQLGSSIYGASAWANRHNIPQKTSSSGSGSGSGSGGSGSTKTSSTTKTYIKNTTSALDGKDLPTYERAVELTKQITEDKLKTNDFSEWKAAGYDIDVQYNTEDRGDEEIRTGSGTFTINGQEKSFENWEDFKSQLRGVVLGDRQEVVERFADTINLVKGDNFGQIATDLGIKYRGRNVSFTDINGGVQITKGSKTFDIPLEGLSLTRRKQRIQAFMENL